jgi:AcrR family transcriptional regulator
VPGDWLVGRRTEVAAEQILDAADELFTHRDAATVGMNEIAAAAGCSRATLYRYFENRDALYTAYVHRESNRMFRRVGEDIAGFTDPRQRLVEGMMRSLNGVRDSPALASWFASTQRPIGGDIAERSDVLRGLVGAFVTSLRTVHPDDVERKATWLVRVMVSLLVFPGRDEAEERQMVEEFVVPTVLAMRQATQ